MSFPAPPRRPAPDRQGVQRARPASAPTPRRASPREETAGDEAPRGPGTVGRLRLDVGSGTWSWSPETFAVLGLDPCTTEPGPGSLAQVLHPDDRARTLEALTAAGQGRGFALVVRSRGPQPWVVLVGRPEPDPDGRVGAVEGMCAAVTTGRPPNADGARAEELETEVEQLRTAMASRAVIEQAKGILMLLTGCGDRTAFDLLGHMSSHTHRKVRDVARAITESASGGAPLPEEIRAILRDACPPSPSPP